MKKRKPPIVLGTCLAVLLIGVGIVYAPHGTPSEEDQAREAQAAALQQQQEQNPKAERPSITPSQASQFVQSQMKSGGGEKQPGMMPPKMAGQGDQPSIAAPKQDAYKPMPNESSTSTQWYTNETPKEPPKEAPPVVKKTR